MVRHARRPCLPVETRQIGASRSSPAAVAYNSMIHVGPSDRYVEGYGKA